MAKKKKKSVVSDAAMAILDGVTKTGIDQIKDDTTKAYLENVWGELYKELPDIAEALFGHGEVLLSGEYKESVAAIMKKMEEDILAFKRKEFDSIDFMDLIERRKSAIFALYNAQEAVSARPSVAKVLAAAANIAEILVIKAIPFILAII